jgi:cell division protease FtsH
MTQALLEWETIDADQINDIMAGNAPRPPQPPGGGSNQPPSAPATESTNGAPATA